MCEGVGESEGESEGAECAARLHASERSISEQDQLTTISYMASWESVARPSLPRSLSRLTL